jgi:hypothetical protein
MLPTTNNFFSTFFSPSQRISHGRREERVGRYDLEGGMGWRRGLESNQHKKALQTFP